MSGLPRSERERIERAVIEVVNTAAIAVRSPRSVGDAIQELLSRELKTILGASAKTYAGAFARRAMADLEFVDNDDVRHVVDVKTHAEDADFSMPNLVSVERLAKLYENDLACFDVLLVRYRAEVERVSAYQATFVPIEWLDWKCLRLGALGWGQIQIRDSGAIEVREQPRTEWMCALCDAVLGFYPREIEKIRRRITRFEREAERWKTRRDGKS